MTERLDRGLSSVFSAEQSCRVRFVEPNNNLVVPDRTMHKSELSDKFDGLDIEYLTQIKLRELGFAPQNDKEKEMLEFFHNPLIHRYPAGDSPARYFMEVIMGNHAILASYLPPNSITSNHKHSDEYKILEDYHITGGEPILKLDSEIHALKSGMSVEVPLNTPHQLKTGEKPAFTLIIMKNAGLVDRKNWHR
ncbi:MAG: hypothetical protein A3B47_01055 [Candidatus Levybacteria bacterium RIFCSPLOWO2_01_FULL_39_24]|nr:MAG: hypothetical protein A2800_03090 [Candidatus Levybacteria bacterium RIFCSPHIGHO2_01_FULL_40_16]OGH28576.1 MAG: hypothetical protein A3E12_02980 [Candidatus Levybacteria bacterium RIFCSPHIGHO2_12_FULL_39_9]OGH45966.1 MAG: hypothetical protein A3B47_01055 [Candidatus Levybacteria bacterium RIFCSPLOWO2_01_FULL_39_24]